MNSQILEAKLLQFIKINPHIDKLLSNCITIKIKKINKKDQKNPTTPVKLAKEKEQTTVHYHKDSNGQTDSHKTMKCIQHQYAGGPKLSDPIFRIPLLHQSVIGFTVLRAEYRPS